jgi:hypothetical protein
VTWKRPADFLVDKQPVVVNDLETNVVDLVTHNGHLLVNELMRWIICQVDQLWELHNKHGIAGRVKEGWKPWDHIYPKSKGQSAPTYNPCGKYAVKLFWLGQWRKIIVDDQMPFNEYNQMLIPVSRPHELWFPLLSKALLKIASLSYNKDVNSECELIDSNIVHMLTGWLVESIPIRSGHKDPMWMLIKRAIPEWNPNCEGEDEDDTVAVSNAKSKPGTDVAAQSLKKEQYPLVVFASYSNKSKQASSCLFTLLQCLC